MSSPSGVPFPPECALNTEILNAPHGASGQSPQPQSDTNTQRHLPGNPAIGLSPQDVYAHLYEELATPLLDELYPHLWLVARKSGSSIDALHLQKAKGRSVFPAEDPRLHLVWKKNTIFIKPIPEFLLNHDFWEHYLQPPERDLSSTSSPFIDKPTTSVFDPSISKGFLRSYAYLIKHPLDFALAKESHLIPENIGWLQWSMFINYFRLIENHDVAKRYRYGQLRLSRLNWAVRIFRPRHTRTALFYERTWWSVSEFRERTTIPLLFLFASISIALSAMQVALAVPGEGLWHPISDDGGLKKMQRAFWLFSIAMVFLWLFTWFILLGIPAAILLSQLVFACTKSRRN